MKFTAGDLINVLQEYDNSTVIEEIRIVDDGINVLTELSYCAYDGDYIKAIC